MSDSILILLIIFIVFGAIGLLIFLFRKELENLKNTKTSDQSLNLFQNQLKEIREEIRTSRQENVKTLQSQLQESGKIVRNVTTHIKDITSQLEKVHSDHQNVKDVKTQLDKLTDVLANPKQRGILGEYFLETLLKNVFQPNQYKLQYKFKNVDIVDAAIFIQKKIVLINNY